MAGICNAQSKIEKLLLKEQAIQEARAELERQENERILNGIGIVLEALICNPRIYKTLTLMPGDEIRLVVQEMAAGNVFADLLEDTIKNSSRLARLRAGKEKRRQQRSVRKGKEEQDVEQTKEPAGAEDSDTERVAEADRSDAAPDGSAWW